MRLEDFQFELTPLLGAMPVWRGRVSANQWREACRGVREKGGRLVALWGADDRDRGEAFTVHAALSVQSGLVIVSLPADGGRFPDVSDIFPAANRMQRAVRDLLGLEAEGAADRRKWLRHAAWPADVFPLRKDFVEPRRPHHEPSQDSNALESAAPRVTGGRIAEQTTFGAPVPPLDAPRHSSLRQPRGTGGWRQGVSPSDGSRSRRRGPIVFRRVLRGWICCPRACE
ncbi:MAG: NADH-quinone oxidoreductase subunit C [Sphingomicrobium sp.]